MKRLIQASSFIGLLVVLMVSVQAQSIKTYRVQIPFNFSIGQESYQAGTYQVSLISNMLLLRDSKNNTIKTFTTGFEEKGKNFERPQLYFSKAEGKTVLTEIAGRDFNAKVKDTDTARDRKSDPAAAPAKHDR